MIVNVRAGVLHLSIHSEGEGEEYLSLWDDEKQARQGGTYVALKLTEEQQRQLTEATKPQDRLSREERTAGSTKFMWEKS